MMRREMSFVMRKWIIFMNPRFVEMIFPFKPRGRFCQHF